jgi:probable HAF family extracellular repeat protein
MKRLLFTLLVSHLLCLWLKAQAPYSFTTIDIPLVGVSAQGGTAINDRGQIVGGFQISPSTVLHGFSLDHKGQFTAIDVTSLGGAILGINNQGQLSGFFGDDNGIHAFLFYRERMTQIDVPGANLTEGTGINDRGHFVGDYRDASNKFHGFLYDDGLFVDIDFPGASATGLQAINNHGQIVGISNDGSVWHGFLHDAGLFTLIDVPFVGAHSTTPRGINDHGDIVGLFTDGPGIHGFLLSEGIFTKIDVPGAILTDVWESITEGTSWVDTLTISSSTIVSWVFRLGTRNPRAS